PGGVFRPCDARLSGRLDGCSALVRNHGVGVMSKQTFQPGQWVSFNVGSRSVQGVVKEDRGPIGRKGRVLYLVEFRREAESPSVSHIELPAEQLKEVKGTVSLG